MQECCLFKHIRQEHLKAAFTATFLFSFLTMDVKYKQNFNKCSISFGQKFYCKSVISLKYMKTKKSSEM